MLQLIFNLPTRLGIKRKMFSEFVAGRALPSFWGAILCVAIAYVESPSGITSFFLYKHYSALI